MRNNSNISEKLLYKIWEEKRLSTALSTSEGHTIEIIDPGIRNNNEAGPDFHHARIRIDNITFTGDIEIDMFHSDWKAHGHHLNQRYNKVILHAVFSNDSSYPFVVTSSGRKVPTLEMQNFLTTTLKETLTDDLNKIKHEDEIKMPCRELNSQVTKEEKLNYIKSLGLLRFKKKCERNLERLKELILLDKLQMKEPVVYHDFHRQIDSYAFHKNDFNPLIFWNQLLFEQLFEALGFSKNKDIMAKLSKTIGIKFFESIENVNVEKIEAALINISGLMPDVNEIPDEKTSEYIRKCVDLWSAEKSKYDSKYFTKTDWHFFKLRPQNFPTVRLAAGARLLEKITCKNYFNRFLNIFKSDNQPKKIITHLRNELVIKADGYWANHFNFNKPAKTNLNYFIGIGRADEMIINIILPIYSVYFELNEENKLSQKVLNLYINYYQKEGNHLVDQVNEVLGFENEKFKSVFYQGMIDLFRNYCVKQKCMQCEIGKKVFT